MKCRNCEKLMKDWHTIEIPINNKPQLYWCKRCWIEHIDDRFNK